MLPYCILYLTKFPPSPPPTADRRAFRENIDYSDRRAFKQYIDYSDEYSSSSSTVLNIHAGNRRLQVDTNNTSTAFLVPPYLQ
jgi:hypothetical protein